MRKIQLKLFDVRRNQNFWFHFCYIPQELWKQYQNKYKVNNMDVQVKDWIKQDFGFEVTHMEDIQKAKDAIKEKYSQMYPQVFLGSESDRQGWARVWLTEKITKLLEDK